MLDVLEREEIELLRRDRVGAMKSQCRSGVATAENMESLVVSKRIAASAILTIFKMLLSCV